MSRIKRLFLFLSVAFFVASHVTIRVFGAVGCSLNDPDRDIKRLFPESTGYRTEFISIENRGGQDLARVVETRLGDALDTKYETLDVPYAYYTVLKEKTPIGRVHGVNQKGLFGGMQLILATDLDLPSPL